MSTTTAAAGNVAGVNDYWLARRQQLFLASCIALIVTAMSFAIRGNLIAPLGQQFGLEKSQIGFINSTAFWGFTLAMIIGGPLADVLGLGRLLILAFAGHALGIILTITAHDYNTLLLSTLIFGVANGMVEAACNPLITTLFPDQKIKRLNMFHVWFPGGIVIGGLTAYAIDQLGLGGKAHGWQIQMASMLLPLLIYGFLFLGKKFPATERVASGVSTSDMFKECLRPFFLLFVVCMLLTAITELGPGQWIPNIMTVKTGVPGILFLVWYNGLMAVGRMNAGTVVHRLSPTGVLIGSSFFAVIALFILSIANNAVMGALGATVFAAGVCFFWPTMLGNVSERFPKTGSLGLAIMGGGGMLASGTVQPIMGGRIDAVTQQASGMSAAQYQQAVANGSVPITAQAAGGTAALQLVMALPVILIVVFAAIYLFDKSRGGYRQEVLIRNEEDRVLDDAQLSPVNQA